jgi:hypothetical protein
MSLTTRIISAIVFGDRKPVEKADYLVVVMPDGSRYVIDPAEGSVEMLSSQFRNGTSPRTYKVCRIGEHWGAAFVALYSSTTIRSDQVCSFHPQSYPAMR